MFFIEVGDEASGYQLTVEGYNGNAGDAVTISSNANGMKFTTKDHDNDLRNGNCAVDTCANCGHGGGWWYRACSWAKINSPYNGTLGSFTWNALPTHPYKLAFSRMTLIQK